MPIQNGNVTTVANDMYVSSGQSAITWLSLTNYTAANVTANVYVVPNGDSAGNLNLILSSLELTPNDTYQIYNSGEKLLLNTGDKIVANASANNSVSTTISYTEI